MNPKVILITVGVTLALVCGGLVLAASQSNAARLEKNSRVLLRTDRTDYNWGEIDYNKGAVIHSFAIKNEGSANLKIANIKTSCMCTQAWLETRAGAGPRFSMGQVSDWQGTLSPGETGEIITEYDPAYHGPSGTGPIERIIGFNTNDPKHSYVELTVKGTVVKK